MLKEMWDSNAGRARREGKKKEKGIDIHSQLAVWSRSTFEPVVASMSLCIIESFELNEVLIEVK